ncbi:CvpA family protein [Fusobacterium perfoetens]|uniref:CvpA family protein n=1 Tax=Fusobacterium perfoetens TaxID=852 RepID=UPI00048558D3|nr:CvpA family protein [Fusobacterium perfoetens]
MYLDIIVLIILGLSIIGGINNGFIVEFISTFGILINLYITHKLTPSVCHITERYLTKQNDTYIYAITFLGLFIIIAILLHLLNTFLKNQQVPFLFRILGGGISFLKGLLICGIFLVFYNIGQEKIKSLSKIGESSIANEYFLQITDEVDFYIPTELKEKINEIKTNKTIDKYMNKIIGE